MRLEKKIPPEKCLGAVIISHIVLYTCSILSKVFFRNLYQTKGGTGIVEIAIDLGPLIKMQFLQFVIRRRESLKSNPGKAPPEQETNQHQYPQFRDTLCLVL